MCTVMIIKVLSRNVVFIIVYLYCYLRMALLKLYVFNVKHKWFRSQYGNDYNPVLQATIYKRRGIYKIARFGEHFGYYQSKNEAMLVAYQIWLKEFNLTTKIFEYKQQANDAKEKIIQNMKALISQRGASEREQPSNAPVAKAGDTYLPPQSLHKTKAEKEQDSKTQTQHLHNHSQQDIFPADFPKIKAAPSFKVEEEIFACYKADCFYLAQTEKKCYKCKKDTNVSAIVLPAGFVSLDHFALEDFTEEKLAAGELPFCSNDYYTILSYVTYISNEALLEIYKSVKKFYFQKAYSYTTKNSYYRSVCSHCGAPQGDNYTIAELNSPFNPSQSAGFSKIRFVKFDVPIRANGEDSRLDYYDERVFDHIPNVAYQEYLNQKASQS